MHRWIVLLLLVSPSAALATSIVAHSEEELVRRADVIAFGTIVRTHTHVDRKGRVITEAELQVRKGLRGAQDGEFIVIAVPGGKLANGMAARTVGAPSLESGQMVLGFFESRGGARLPLGLSFGLLRVVPDREGSLRVYRELEGLSLFQANGRPAPSEPFELIGVPLDDYLRRIGTRVKELGLPAPGTVRP